MIFKHRVFWMHSTFHQKIQTKNVAQKKVSLQHFAPSTPCGFASFSSLHNCRRAWQLKKMAKIFFSVFLEKWIADHYALLWSSSKRLMQRILNAEMPFLTFSFFAKKKKEFQKFESCQKTLILCAPNCLLRHRKVWKKKRNVTFKKRHVHSELALQKSPHQT